MDTNTHTTPNATGNGPTVPTPDVQPTGDQPARTAADKLRSVQAYATSPPGSPERGARMRREGSSTSQIATWRKQRDRGALDQPAPQPRGPKPTPPNPLADEVARLRAEHAHVPARRDQAELVIDVQKNRGGNSCVQASEELRNMDKSSPRTPASRWRDVLFAPTEKNAHLPGQPTLPEHERSCAPPCPTWLR